MCTQMATQSECYVLCHHMLPQSELFVPLEVTMEIHFKLYVSTN